MYSKKEAIRWTSLYREDRGFGLIEAMISVALLAIGILAIASGEMSALTMQKRSRENLTAMALATNMVEMIRRNPSSINDYGGLKTDSAASIMATSSSLVNADFGYWKKAIETGLPEGGSVDCKGTQVSKGCGWVQVSDSSFTAVTGTGTASSARNVVVKIVWPGQPNGVQVTGVIAQ